MVQVRNLTEIRLRDLWREVQSEDDWWGEVKGQTLRVVKTVRGNNAGRGSGAVRG